MNTFSISEAVRFGWATFKKRPWFFIGACVGLVAINLLINGIFGKLGVPFLAFVVQIVMNTFLTIAYVKLALGGASSPETLTIQSLWEPRHFLNMLGTSLLVMIIVVVGMILLVIPGIIAAIALSFATFSVVDKSLGPIAAIKESYRVTKGHWGALFLFFLVVVGINILGMILLLVGLLVSTPVSMLATVFVYRKLSAQSVSAVSVPHPSTAAGA